MNGAIDNPYKKYKQSAVDTAPPEKLLVMLYDGAIKFLTLAKKALDMKNYEEANEYNLRVQEILVELNATLDMSYGEIPQRLRKLYDFYQRQMILANLKKDPKLLEPVLRFLRDYRELWEKATLISKMGSANG